MKKVYKEIITINHNDKLFTIFLADDNRLTFLETNEEGKYFYPLLDDFIELNNIYNNHNPFICDITKYAFKEKVKRTALGSLLSLVIITTGVCTFKPYTVNALKDEVILSQINIDEKELIEITDKEKLDEVLGYKYVSVDEVHRAIDANESIPFLYKIKIHLFLDVFMIKHPNWDLRIFYENIKTALFSIVDDNYFIEIGQPGVGAQYKGDLNQVLLPETLDDETFYHELSHLFDVYYREYDDKIIIKKPMITTLNETMTNELSNCITTPYSYLTEETVFNYFRNYVDFDFYDYNYEGNSPYVNLLKERYPNVDIDFIFIAMDTVNKIERYSGDYIYINQVNDLLDEFFKICLIELSNEKENFYAPFSEFSKILLHTYNKTNDAEINYESIMYNYLDRYNGVLNARGYSGEYITKEKIIEKIAKYEDIERLFYKDGIVIPACDTYTRDDDGINYYMKVIEEDGSIKEMPRSGYTWTNSVKDLSKIIQITSVEYFDIIGTNEYWKNIAIDSGAAKIFDLEPIPIYLNGELITIDSVDNIMIAVGQKSDEKIAYKIKDKDSVIYSSDELAYNFSDYVSLRRFLKDYNPKDSSKLELANVFNDYYLSSVLSSEYFFSNLMVKDGSVKFVPKYMIRVSKETGTFGFILDNCYFFIENGNPILYPLHATYSSNYGKVYLKDILTYYNVFDEDILEYEFTEDELMEYYENYIKDMDRENNNSMGL